MSTVTIHMAASLDGFIARNDGSVDWLETEDDFPRGESPDQSEIQAFVDAIDCYVMGSRTYELAMSFEAKGFGWVYGKKPTFVLTHRELPRIRDTIEFYSGDLADLFANHLRQRFKNIWVAGGGAVAGECLRLGLADEVSYSILPVVIGDGIRFFENLDAVVALHLSDVKAYRNGTVELRYQVRKGAAS
jgi:dihydrofolate reductase